MKTKRTKEEIEAKVTELVGGIMYDYYRNQERMDSIDSALAVEADIKKLAEQIDDSGSYQLDLGEIRDATVNALVGWLARGEAMVKPVLRIESWQESDGEFHVSVVYRDDSHWAGCVSRARFDRMQREEQECDVECQEAQMANISAGMTPRQYMIVDTLVSDEHVLCAWCKSIKRRDDGAVTVALTDVEFEATRLAGESHGICTACRDRLMEERRAKIKTHTVGTPVRIVRVEEDSFGDPRNAGRLGVIERVIISGDEADADDALYEIRFIDGKQHDEPHVMDLECGMTNGNSTHYHSELESI